MNNSLKAATVTLCFSAIACYPPADAAETPRFEATRQRVEDACQTLAQKSIAQPKFDSGRAKSAMSDFLQRMDCSKAWLTAAEVKSLTELAGRQSTPIVGGDIAVFHAASNKLVEKFPDEKEAIALVAELPADFASPPLTSPEDFSDDADELLLRRRRLIADRLTVCRLLEPNVRKSTSKVAESFAISKKHLVELSERDLASLAIESIAKSYDPANEYFTPEVASRGSTSLLPTYSPEIRIAIQQHAVWVQRTVEQNRRFGNYQLRPGDRILEWSEGRLYEPTKQQVMPLLAVEYWEAGSVDFRAAAGDKNSEITLKIASGSPAKLHTVSIHRLGTHTEQIGQFEKAGVVIGPDTKAAIGYIRPELPYETSPQNEMVPAPLKEFRHAIDALKRRSIRALVLDMRIYRGPIRELAAALMGEDVIGQAVGNSESPIPIDSHGQVYWDGPLVVVVDESTGENFELLVAGLIEHQRAVVVGHQTAGRAVGFPLWLYSTGQPDQSNEPGMLKITSGRLYRSNGTSWAGECIRPQIEMPKECRSFFTLQHRVAPMASISPPALNLKPLEHPLKPETIQFLSEQSAARMKKWSMGMNGQSPDDFWNVPRQSFPKDKLATIPNPWALQFQPLDSKLQPLLLDLSASEAARVANDLAEKSQAK